METHATRMWISQALRSVRIPQDLLMMGLPTRSSRSVKAKPTLIPMITMQTTPMWMSPRIVVLGPIVQWDQALSVRHLQRREYTDVDMVTNDDGTSPDRTCTGSFRMQSSRVRGMLMYYKSFTSWLIFLLDTLLGGMVYCNIKWKGGGVLHTECAEFWAQQRAGIV